LKKSKTFATKSAHSGLGHRRLRIGEDEHIGAARHQLPQQPQPLRPQLLSEIVHAGHVAARPIEAIDKTELDRIGADAEDDRNSAGGGLGRDGRRRAARRHDDGGTTLNKIGDQIGQSFVLLVRPAIFDHDIAAIDEARFGESCTKRRRQMGARLCGAVMEESDHRQSRLLRSRRERPSGRAGEQGDQFAALHSMTSSARC
jgi:hypothetical protein